MGRLVGAGPLTAPAEGRAGGALGPGVAGPAPPGGGSRGPALVSAGSQASESWGPRAPAEVVALERERGVSVCGATSFALFGNSSERAALLNLSFVWYRVKEQLRHMESESQQQTAVLLFPCCALPVKQCFTRGRDFHAHWNVTFPAINYYINTT